MYNLASMSMLHFTCLFCFCLFVCSFLLGLLLIKDVFCISLEQPNLVKLVIKCAQNLSPDAAIFDLAKQLGTCFLKVLIT